jgi:prepilin-type N-terminal cleavage/methylation domain-containing protein
MLRLFHLRRNERGFTLVELMVVVAIAAILIGFTYAGFTGMLNRYRCQGAVNRIAQVLKLAQMKAIEQSVRYVVNVGIGNDNVTITFDNDDCATTVPVLFDRINLAREYPGINITSGTTCNVPFYFDYRGIPKIVATNAIGACSVQLVPRDKPTEQGSVTISSVGRIIIATPDEWKH